MSSGDVEEFYQVSKCLHGSEPYKQDIKYVVPSFGLKLQTWVLEFAQDEGCRIDILQIILT